MNHCRPVPCPPAPSAPRPLAPSGCVAVPHGNTRGGIFDAPWVGGSFADAQRMTVPTNCPPGSGTPLPGVATGPHPRYAPDPYGNPQIVPGPCPPPCLPRPCPPRPQPPRPPGGIPTPTTPPTYTPVPPGTPPTLTPGGNGRPPMTMPRPPWIRPTPVRPLQPGRGTAYDKVRPPAALVPQLKGFGSVFVPSANTSGIFDIPRCNGGPGVPYAGSPYSDPTIVPPPCPPRPCPPPPCDGSSGQERRPRIIVPPTNTCPERQPRPIDCPPERFPRVPPPQPCAGFGAGPDGLGFWR